MLDCVICTTVKLPEFGYNVINSFIEYHLKIGFKHIYIFFDDENDHGITNVKKIFNDDGITVIKNDGALKLKWQANCPSYESLIPYIENEVQARQRLNCELALRFAYKKRYDWLLHIDSDELFYTEKNDNIQSHFKSLSDKNIGHMTYLNFEGVPEEMHGHINGGSDIGSSDMDRYDYFKNVTLFRKHHSIVSMNQRALESMKYWENRRNHGQYFIAYDIGKSAVRVMPNVECTNVHKFTILNSKVSAGTSTSNAINNNNDAEKIDTSVVSSSSLKYCTAVLDGRNLNIDNYCKMTDPVILHYVVCGLPWLKAKYDILGAFPNSWYGGKIPIAPSFHRDARDLILNKNNTNTIVKRFYEKEIMLDKRQNTKEYNDMIESGVCVRISKPSSILNNGNVGKGIKVKQKVSTDKKKDNPIIALMQSFKDGEMAHNKTQDGDIKTANSNNSNKRMGNNNQKNKDISNEVMTYDKNWIIANAVNKFL